MTPIDLTARRFGKLIAINPVKGKIRRRWLCICDCGKETHSLTTHLLFGRASSCGCERRRVRHGHTSEGRPTKAWEAWSGLRKRCDNVNCKGYPNYGGRGITYDPRWAVFENFLNDMGNAPAGTSLDRIDNNGPYSKANCRWATRSQQNNNTRQNRFIEYRGDRRTAAEWAPVVGIKASIIRDRIRNGWPIERVFQEVPRG